MSENKLIFSKCLKLVIAIILIFDQISNSFGSENRTGVCPSLTSTTSTNVKCEHNGTRLTNCEDPQDGTTVSISCNPFYEKDSLQEDPIRICTNGKWNSTIPECYPICGKVPSRALDESKQLLDSTNLPHDYPWHVGVYKNNKDFICSGSIINPKIILTAAHCFTNNDGSIMPSENYLIAAGKYYRNYADERDEYAQYSTVSEIHVSERYRGARNLFTSDIAILILSKPFVLSIAVQPVCIESNKDQDVNMLLDNNSIGIVTGWGFIQPGGPLAETLKELIIPYVPFDKCFSEASESFRKFITFDKICGGYINNGTSICQGDGGGGFVFKNDFRDRYYIKAVASLGPTTENLECDVNAYATYTLISHHINFVESLMDLYNNIDFEISKSIPL